MSRMPVSRVARIGTWTGAALAWGTTAVFVKAASADPAETAATVPPPSDDVATQVGPLATMPEPPNDGLVILRFTPVTAPPQQIIVKTRYVQVEGSAPATASSTSSGSTKTASSGGSTAATPTATATAAPPPPAAPTVVATPTTQPPAPVSSGS